MPPIPDFIDDYHLPPGEHVCNMSEIEELLLSTAQRQRVWGLFKNLLFRLETLGLFPDEMLIDGSFVTGRNEPADVDFCALIPPQKIRDALANAADQHERDAIDMLTRDMNEMFIREAFGAHMLIVPDRVGMARYSKFFRTKLRERDSRRDPEWVTIPEEKGILKVILNTHDTRR